FQQNGSQINSSSLKETYIQVKRNHEGLGTFGGQCHWAPWPWKIQQLPKLLFCCELQNQRFKFCRLLCNSQTTLLFVKTTNNVPIAVPRWKPSVGWSVDLDRRSHPDRCKDQDNTRLNLAKQRYAKDVREAHEERFQLELQIHEIITNLIRKPFPAVKSGVMEMISEKVAARKKYLVVHFSHYYQIQTFHYPAEFALAEFSIFNGLGDGVSGLIDVGKIPLGYYYLVREGRK
ncbi:unnamed protein product, partial [Allacma fusca]